jgi:RNA polymerase sigma factor (TIGR02999 family)
MFENSNSRAPLMDGESVRDDEHVRNLLDRWQGGDRSALEELTPLVYRELYKLASKYMRQERSGHTLQATALVNEAFLRLGNRGVSFADGSHFYGVAAKLMRHILVDHAKARIAQKRGGGAHRESDTNAEKELATMGGIDLEEVDDALTKLGAENAAAANAMELHYFAGMNTEETAKILGVSVSTVGRDLRFAKAWLLHQLQAKK